MANNITSIKSRIKSIKSTKKITSSMELISNVKLQKFNSLLLKNSEYVSELSKLYEDNLADYISDHHSNNDLYIVFTSDEGLCGTYNEDIYKLIKKSINLDDQMYIIGSKIYKRLKEDNYQIINDVTSSDQVDYQYLLSFSEDIINKYLNDEIGDLYVLYTKSINSVSGEAKIINLTSTNFSNDNKDTEYVPSKKELFEYIFPLMIKSEIYTCFLEAKKCEYMIRRNSMNDANDNADNLLDELSLIYNQARQASITQEITEIISGSNA